MYGLTDTQDFRYTLSRSRLETLCRPLFERLMDIVGQVLGTADVKPDAVQEVILVGGSTRIPRVRSLLEEFFPNSNVNYSVDADRMVVYGAALMAAQKCNQKVATYVHVLEVLTFSVAVAVRRGIANVIAPRGSRIPCTFTKTYTTAMDNQKSVEFKLVEGERPMVEDCHLLGTFMVTNLKPAPKGHAVEVATNFDGSGILAVKARELDGDARGALRIDFRMGRMRQPDVDQHFTSYQSNAATDAVKLANAEAQNRYEDVLYDLRKIAEDPSNGMSEIERRAAKERIDVEEKWLNTHATAVPKECEDHEAELRQLHRLFMRPS